VRAGDRDESDALNSTSPRSGARRCFVNQTLMSSYHGGCEYRRLLASLKLSVGRRNTSVQALYQREHRGFDARAQRAIDALFVRDLQIDIGG
jgi:hypothetical protein